MSTGRAKAQLVTAMVLFGTIGVFVRGIDLPSGTVAMVRGLSGAAFLLLWAKGRGEGVSLTALRGRLAPLMLSGAALGFNWLLLFESFRYTTVATATLCYYLAPVLVVLTSPLLLGERLTGRKVLCVVFSFTGMIFVSGAAEHGLPTAGEARGVLLALGAALLYAALMIANKRIAGISPFDRTAVQLAAAGVVMLPYCLMTGLGMDRLTLTGGVLLLVVGVVHTGVTYLLYFGSMARLPGQSVSILSYIDPATAVFCSVLILREPFSLYSLSGAVLVLGAALASER